MIERVELEFNLDLSADDMLAFAAEKSKDILAMLMSGLNNFAVNILTAILLLYFLLSGGLKMERYIARLLPFAEHNKVAVVDKINVIVKSNAIGIPVLAVIQGLIAGLGYALCGVNHALLFGILTGFASVIPVVGTMLIWIPLVISLYFEGSMTRTIGLLIYCVVIVSQCDNVLRMVLQKRMANIHPLVTIFGVIAGLPLFGFMGLIFGPLLVSLFLMFLDIFAREYVAPASDHESESAPLPVTAAQKPTDKVGN